MKPLERLRSDAMNTGPLASAAWCVARDVFPQAPHWSVDICVDNVPGADHDEPPIDARFAIEIFGDEWGFRFLRGDAASWIRVTDIPFVHGRDDFELLPRTPRLEEIGILVRALEVDHDVRFDRARPLIRSTFDGGDRFAAWVADL
jgi:hypothetical protein